MIGTILDAHWKSNSELFYETRFLKTRKTPLQQDLSVLVTSLQSCNFVQSVHATEKYFLSK